MTTKHQILNILLLAVLLLSIGCEADRTTNTSSEQVHSAQDKQAGTKGDNQAGNDEDQTADDQQADSGSPFSGEDLKKSYLNLAQGKWQDATNQANVMEIDGNIVKQTQNGKLISESEFEVDATCAAAKCLQNGKQPFGWCFILKNALGTCQIVTRCDSEKMIYKVASEGAEAKTYMRIKEN